MERVADEVSTDKIFWHFYIIILGQQETCEGRFDGYPKVEKQLFLSHRTLHVCIRDFGRG